MKDIALNDIQTFLFSHLNFQLYTLKMVTDQHLRK